MVGVPAGVSGLPRGAVGRWLLRLRVWVRLDRLDDALADGADPWSSGELMVRAERLGSLAERRSIAAGLRALVELAEYQRPASPYLVVRHRLVLEEREALLLLAERLDHPLPVEVAVVARLRGLVSDCSSPVYAGGADPDRLAEVTTECLESLAP